MRLQVLGHPDAYRDNEELTGEWFVRTGKRDDICVAIKFGLADLARVPNGSA